MVLYKMKSESREVQLARIEAMYEGKGRAMEENVLTRSDGVQKEKR